MHEYVAWGRLLLGAGTPHSFPCLLIKLIHAILVSCLSALCMHAHSTVHQTAATMPGHRRWRTCSFLLCHFSSSMSWTLLRVAYSFARDHNNARNGLLLQRIDPLILSFQVLLEALRRDAVILKHMRQLACRVFLFVTGDCHAAVFFFGTC